MTIPNDSHEKREVVLSTHESATYLRARRRARSYIPAVASLESRHLLSTVTALDTSSDAAGRIGSYAAAIQSIVMHRLGNFEAEENSDGSTSYVIQYKHNLSQKSIGSTLRLLAALRAQETQTLAQ